MANEPLDRELFLQGKQTPVLFGTALGNFAVDHVLDAFINWAPEPKAHPTQDRLLKPMKKVYWLCL
jgi:peptide chain release factor 3